MPPLQTGATPACAFVACLLWACTAEPTSSTPAEGATEDRPSPYSWDAGVADDAEFAPEVLETALAELVNGLMTVGAAPVLDTYEMLLSEAEPTCPAWYEQDGNRFWYARCTTSGGTYFDGYGFTNVYTDAELFGPGGGFWNATVVSGAATIRDAAGHTFHLGGQAYDGTGYGDDGRQLWVSSVVGGFAWDGENHEQSWLGQQVSPGLLLYAMRFPEAAGLGVTGNYLHADGTLGGIGVVSTGFDLDEVALVSESLGMPCELEPTGTISVRDAQGTWWDVRFDLVQVDDRWVLDGECDGCGSVYRQDEWQGDVCVDFTPLLDWTERPW